MRLVDRDSAEGLRQNRERLSTDITDLINEYAPKVFNDFDRKYLHYLRITTIHYECPVFYNTDLFPSYSILLFNALSLMKNKIADNVFRPASLAALEAANASVPSTPGIDLQRLASGFFTNAAAKMDWLDDRNIFNWNRQEDSDVDDSSYFLDRNSGGITGSASEAEITAHKRRKSTGRRSRTSSLIHSDGGTIKVESMTTLSTQKPFGELRAPIARRAGFKLGDEDDGPGSESTVDNLKIEDDGYAGDRDENIKVTKKIN